MNMRDVVALFEVAARNGYVEALTPLFSVKPVPAQIWGLDPICDSSPLGGPDAGTAAVVESGLVDPRCCWPGAMLLALFRSGTHPCEGCSMSCRAPKRRVP